MLSGGLGRLLVVMSGSHGCPTGGRSERAMDERMSVPLDVFESKTPVVVSHKKSRKFMIYINLVDDEFYFR